MENLQVCSYRYHKFGKNSTLRQIHQTLVPSVFCCLQYKLWVCWLEITDLTNKWGNTYTMNKNSALKMHRFKYYVCNDQTEILSSDEINLWWNQQKIQILKSVATQFFGVGDPWCTICLGYSWINIKLFIACLANCYIILFVCLFLYCVWLFNLY